MEKFVFALNDLLTEDIEIQQYQVLSTLKKYRNSLKEFKIYPALKHLQEAKVNLENIIQDNFQYELNEISRIEENSDNEFPNTSFKDTQNNYENNQSRKEFLYWIISEIDSLIEEAETIENFVLENITITGKGKTYDYRKEGIFVIKNASEKSFNIYFYNLKLSKIILDDHSAIEHRLLTSISYDKLNESSEKNIIFEIASKYFNQSKVTVWEVDYELDLPFEEIILPAALECLKNKII